MTEQGRTWQDLRGQDRTGKARNGQDRTGHDRKGREGHRGETTGERIKNKDRNRTGQDIICDR